MVYIKVRETGLYELRRLSRERFTPSTVKQAVPTNYPGFRRRPSYVFWKLRRQSLKIGGNPYGLTRRRLRVGGDA